MPNSRIQSKLFFINYFFICILILKNKLFGKYNFNINIKKY